MNRKLVVKRPITVESFKIEKVRSKEGGVVEPFEGMYALRQEDIVEVTASRAKQLLTTSPETFSLKGREEIWEFLDETLVEDETGEIELSELWKAYQDWAQKQGKPPMSKEDFQREIEGLFEVVQSEGKTYLRGLRFKGEK